jgi:hypothetical protein
MKRLRLTRARQEEFLRALADTGSITAAVVAAGTSRTRVYELRKVDSVFAADWDEAEEAATDRLESEARRRAVEGVAEPLVSAGKLVRDDAGQPVVIRRYSDHLLISLLRMHRPVQRATPVRFALPVLSCAADATTAMASITVAVASGEISPSEAAELSKLVEAYVKALEASEFEQRLRVLEAKKDGKRL